MIKFGEILLKILILLAVSFVSIAVGSIVTALVYDFVNWEFVTTPTILSDPYYWRIVLAVTPIPAIIGMLIK